jgi:cation diffusion facilitator family transporter
MIQLKKSELAMSFTFNRLQVLFFSLFISFSVVGLKWWAFIVSGSLALKTDALESVLNIAATILAIIATYQAQRPADSNHPYGHGKIEYFSSSIEGGMMLFASFYLLYEGIHGLISGSNLRNLNNAFIYSGIGAILNAILGAWQLHQGKKLKSEAIITDAKHLLSDFYTTLGVILGLLLVKATGLIIFDSIMGIAVAVLLFYNAYKIIIKSAKVLSDVEDPVLIKKIIEEINSPAKPKHIIDVHHLRTFRSGLNNFVDLHLVMPEFWDLRNSHDAAESYCKDINQKFPEDCEFHPHIEPCWQKFCTRCAIEPCPIRQKPFEAFHIFKEEEVVLPGEDDR